MSHLEAKAEMRRALRARLNAMPPEERALASLQICSAAAHRIEFKGARHVALFAPLPSEPDVRPLIEEAWAQGKRVALPSVRQGDEPRLAWHEFTDWSELVARGPHGILEPDPKRCEAVLAVELDLAFVPGLAFDALGNRLGRGGGYYDRFLAAAPGTLRRIGLFFARQEVAHLPLESHDAPLDLVITEAREIARSLR